MRFIRPMPWRFAALAVALLAMTLAWHVPMMLWDHLDLVPLLDAWRHGELRDSAFLDLHGGHLHAAAYAVLLLTTTLSGGQPWLDCVASWLLLLGYAAIVRVFVREGLPAGTRCDAAVAALAILLALYPGHLANLQWGWQVAVFLCLAGVAVAIHALTRPVLSWPRLLLALAGGALACLGFATGIAIIPVAVLLVALRRDLAPRRRVAMIVPWLVAGAAIAVGYHGLAAQTAPDPLAGVHYALNFLGAGIARFATDLAPWLAVAGVALAASASARHWRERACLPWIGLIAFALLASLLVAAGRAQPFGPEQAFVTRYVSFSSMFWLGLVGLLGHTLGRSRSRLPRIALCVTALFACANALHMIRKAVEVGARTRAIAQTLHDDWPRVDDALLGEIYFERPDIARQRLAQLRAWGYAPFDPAVDRR